MIAVQVTFTFIFLVHTYFWVLFCLEVLISCLLPMVRCWFLFRLLSFFEGPRNTIFHCCQVVFLSSVRKPTIPPINRAIWLVLWPLGCCRRRCERENIYSCGAKFRAQTPDSATSYSNCCHNVASTKCALAIASATIFI